MSAEGALWGEFFWRPRPGSDDTKGVIFILLIRTSELFAECPVKHVLFLIVALCVAPICEAWAQTALPKVGTCPSGFYTSGKYCIPIKDDAHPAMQRAGQCPSGYYTSGKYCVATRKDAPPAVQKNGTCPSGYYTSGSYCLKQKR